MSAVVGVIGAGQLARMLALAGLPSGLRFVFLDPAPDACAAALGEHLCGAYDDRNLLDRLARRCDVVTYEFENVPEEAVAFLAERTTVLPGAAALGAGRDRLREKTLFQSLGIPTPPFAAVDSLESLRAAVARIGLPAVLKTRTLGYDGKGQAVLRQPEDVDAAWARLGAAPLILEGFVEFSRELSMLAIRGRDGKKVFYPLSENVHLEGILHLSRSCVADAMQDLARQYVERLLDHLGYVGVLALELFQVGDALMANEMAPRAHNSGHWTIEGAETSQFENHLRAVMGLPLGATSAVGHAAMVNLIGELPNPGDILAVAGAHLHVYGKKPLPGRKLGHVTLRADDPRDLQVALERTLALVGRRR